MKTARSELLEKTAAVTSCTRMNKDEIHLIIFSGELHLVVFRNSFLLIVQTGSGAHPASYAMGSFPGLKRLERDIDH